MKFISKQLFNAVHYSLEHPEESLTKIASLFKVDRHSIQKHKEDINNYIYDFNDKKYFLSDEEKETVFIYINNNITLAEAARKFGVKTDTIKRRLNIMGYNYEKQYKRQFNRNAFNTITTEEEAYWLGFILADGYINEDRGFIRIKLGIIDENHLHKFAKFMQEQGNDYIKYDTGGSYNKDNKCCYIEFSSRSLVDNLTKYSLHQGKSCDEVPYLKLPYQLIPHYIRGMIDGDGHIEDGYFKYVGSLAVCNYIKDYFSQYYNFKQDCKYIYENGKIFSFEVRSQEVNSIIKQLYNNSVIYLDRKHKVAQNL